MPAVEENTTVEGLHGEDIISNTTLSSLHTDYMTVPSSVTAVQPPTCCRCGVSAGIDLKVLDCGCYLHVVRKNEQIPYEAALQCHKNIL